MTIQQIMDKITANPKKLFLIDGLGALLTAFLIGVILVRFEYAFGMPIKVLYILALAAFVFAIYSFFCYWRILGNWRFFLKAIAIANLIYCCTTLFLMIFHFQKLTILGFIYFLGEIAIIVVLAILELKTANNKKA